MDELAWGGESEVEQPNPLEGPLLVTPEVGRYAIEQAVAKVLFHVGFEGLENLLPTNALDFQASAFDLVTGVAIEYIQKIGATLTLYMSCNDLRKQYTEEVKCLRMT